MTTAEERIARLEAQVAQLPEVIAEKDRIIARLEARVAELGPTVAANVRWRGKGVRLSVLEVHPDARLDPTWPVLQRCDYCGLERRSFVRDQDEFPQQRLRARVVSASLRGDAMRIREWPTTILVSERFAQYLASRAVPGSIDFEPVDLV